MNKTCILSFPRSGRHLLHTALTAGYRLTSPRHVDQGNEEAVRAKLVVSHNVAPRPEIGKCHCIVMIREPIECLISFFLRNFPKERTLKKFKQVLEGECEGNRVGMGWLYYYQHFVRAHVLSEVYSHPRLIVGYEQLVGRPRETLLNIAQFVGGRFDVSRALKTTEPIEFTHNHFKSHLYSPQLKGEIERALQPEAGLLRERGII